MFWMSLAVSPSPRPLSGSLLVTLRIWQASVPPESQLSDTVVLTVTVTILWLGGQRLDGLAVEDDVGACVSLTVMVCWQLAELPLESVADQVIVVVPFGYGA